MPSSFPEAAAARLSLTAHPWLYAHSHTRSLESPLLGSLVTGCVLHGGVKDFPTETRPALCPRRL